MIAALVGVMLAAGPTRATPLTRPALDELAVRIVEQAEGAKPESPVGVFVEGAPPVLARAFASALSAQLAAKKRGPSVIEATNPAEAEALARAHDVRSLLRVVVALDGSKLVARGDAIHTWVSFWAGASTRREGPAAALTAAVDADAQALALAAPLSLPPVVAGPLKVALTSLAKLTTWPAALAFGDLDGDAKGELAVLLEDGLWVLDTEGRVKWRSDLRDVPGAASPSREPFGAMAIAQGRLVLASSRKARPVALTAKGARLDTSPAEAPVFVEGLGVRPAPGLNVFERAVVVNGRGLELPSAFTTTSSRGAATLIVYPDGTAMLIDGGAVPGTRFSGAGAGSALADLDGDGTPELLLSSTRYAADIDELKVLSLEQARGLASRGGTVTEATALWAGATPRGKAIVALGADLDGDKSEELVIGVWLADGTGELFVAKRVPSPPAGERDRVRGGEP